ncbi:hypothetical protein JW960_28330 [candidate division KSB1 bacterium]|nr:hypothetical protein [candidate division KSB1 bacterium]
MPQFKKILILRNEVEASIMDAHLTEQNIPFIIRSYHDSAYNGIFQFQKGWGHLESDEEYRETIETIYNDTIETADENDELLGE